MVGFVKSALNLFGINKKEGVEGAIGLDEFLAQLPALTGYDVQFKQVNRDGEVLYFEVEGSEVDSFVGTSSEMLDALSHVAMRVLRRSQGLSNAPAGEAGGEQIRVVFDCGGFRDRKTQELKELAADQRQKVIDSGGKPAYISALGPSERKVIHTYLAELGEVTSESIGRGNFKRIRVKLKEDSPHRRAPAPRAEGDGQPREAREGGGHHRRGSGGGGRHQHRRGGGGGGRGRGGRGGAPRHSGEEVNGNVAQPAYNENSNQFFAEGADDNFGNRLRPGEEPIFKYSPNGYGDGNNSNN